MNTLFAYYVRLASSFIDLISRGFNLIGYYTTATISYKEPEKVLIKKKVCRKLQKHAELKEGQCLLSKYYWKSLNTKKNSFFLNNNNNNKCDQRLMWRETSEMKMQRRITIKGNLPYPGVIVCTWSWKAKEGGPLKPQSSDSLLQSNKTDHLEADKVYHLVLLEI